MKDLADNLPMVSSNKEEPRIDEGFNRRDRELIYRALVELSSDIGDLKKMLANFLYSSFTNQELNYQHQNYRPVA